MKKRLLEQQFTDAVRRLDVGEQTKKIAFGVLVEGKPQSEYVKTFGLTKGAVSQAVSRVWLAYEANNTPKGYEKVTALLTEHQAFIVKKWAVETADKRKKEK